MIVGNGTFALRWNTTGFHNTAIGHDALYLNTTGFANVVGSDAGWANNTGNGNVVIGNDALYLNTTGIRNTAIGTLSLRDNRGSYNESALSLNIYDGSKWNIYTSNVTRDPVNNFVFTSALTNISMNRTHTICLGCTSCYFVKLYR